MSTTSHSPAAPVIPLFPADRIQRFMLRKFVGRSSVEEHRVTMVVGADGGSRQVERSRTLTGVEVQEAARFGAAAVWPR